jgi:hypothetical protein
MKSKITQYLPPTLFFIFILWMIGQADLDQENLIMDIGHSVPFGDKIGHFLLFGILALLLNMALGFKQLSIASRRFHLGSILVLVFAICEEFTQLAFETRTFDIVDILFDLFGIGLLSSISFRRYIVEKFQSFSEYLSRNLLIE